MSRTGTTTRVREKTETAEPPQYRVLLLNDDYTPMDFVVSLLVSVFRKGVGEATRIMLDVHEKGAGVCGVYPFEVAETKVEQANGLARQAGHPLQCDLEPA